MPHPAVAARRAESSIGWADIEALPLYAAIGMALVLIASMITDLSPILQATTLKVVGIFGCMALRHAWLRMDEGGTVQA